jgi:hypothetical protein
VLFLFVALASSRRATLKHARHCGRSPRSEESLFDLRVSPPNQNRLSSQARLAQGRRSPRREGPAFSSTSSPVPTLCPPCYASFFSTNISVLASFSIFHFRFTRTPIPIPPISIQIFGLFLQVGVTSRTTAAAAFSPHPSSAPSPRTSASGPRSAQRASGPAPFPARHRPASPTHRGCPSYPGAHRE